jgi:hypothetical protein
VADWDTLAEPPIRLVLIGIEERHPIHRFASELAICVAPSFPQVLAAPVQCDCFRLAGRRRGDTALAAHDPLIRRAGTRSAVRETNQVGARDFGHGVTFLRRGGS